MNSVTDLIQNHRSIRKFQDKDISEEQLIEIYNAAKSASTSCFMQCSSIIHVTDPVIREALVPITGNQAYVASAPHFFVFCADYHRHQQCVDNALLGMTEQLLSACVDTGMMAQNALLAAESMGLGGVYIGAIRNQPLDIIELLQLPHNVFPLFGLCLGYPDENPEKKPRLPNSILIHENHYHALNKEEIATYDGGIREYYKRRTKNKKDTSWIESIEPRLQKEARPFMKDNLQQQGFMKK